MANKKYELTQTKRPFSGVVLTQIVAVTDFGKVRKGELGGWVEGEHNLSQSGDCWITPYASAWGNAYVSEDAQVTGKAKVYGSAQVFGHAYLEGNVRVTANAKIGGYASLGKTAFLSGRQELTEDLYFNSNQDLVDYFKGKENGN